jgi:hypothetical protein
MRCYIDDVNAGISKLTPESDGYSTRTIGDRCVIKIEISAITRDRETIDSLYSFLNFLILFLWMINMTWWSSLDTLRIKRWPKTAASLNFL